MVYSLLATCKARGVNERAWLEDVLRRIPEYEQAGKDYADLLPGNWSALSAKQLKPTSHSHKKTATGITLVQVAVKLYQRTYFLECLPGDGGQVL